MRRTILIIIISLLSYNSGFTTELSSEAGNKCVEGDCINGYGTFTWKDGKLLAVWRKV